MTGMLGTGRGELCTADEMLELALLVMGQGRGCRTIQVRGEPGVGAQRNLRE